MKVLVIGSIILFSVFGFSFPDDCSKLQKNMETITVKLKSDIDPGSDINTINDQMNSVLDKFPECNDKILDVASKMYAEIKAFVKRGEAKGVTTKNDVPAKQVTESNLQGQKCQSIKSSKEKQKCKLDLARSKAKQTTPYWLIDFNKEDSFTKISFELAMKMSSIKEVVKSPFCIATFFHSIHGFKTATAFCIAEFITKINGGYDNLTSCEIFSIDLGNGKISESQQLPNKKGYGSKKCDLDTAVTSIYRGSHNMMGDELFQDGVKGNLGVYVFRDDFGALREYLK